MLYTFSSLFPKLFQTVLAALLIITGAVQSQCQFSCHLAIIVKKITQENQPGQGKFDLGSWFQTFSVYGHLALFLCLQSWKDAIVLKHCWPHLFEARKQKETFLDIKLCIYLLVTPLMNAEHSLPSDIPKTLSTLNIAVWGTKTFTRVFLLHLRARP